MMASGLSGSAELTGGDWFLVTLGRMMRAAGQGEHTGLTVLQLGPGIDTRALRAAAERLADASPIAAGRLGKSLFGLPRWSWPTGARPRFPLTEHPLGTRWEQVAERHLASAPKHPVCFDLIPEPSGATLLLRWRHALLDGKGAELFLAEITRLAADASAEPRAESWGIQAPRQATTWQTFGEAERFNIHYDRLALTPIKALGAAKPGPGVGRFAVECFSREETARIVERAAAVSRGMFQIGWFLAVAMRAHQRVLAGRGERAESFRVHCAVQERKRGARHPIWQNQLSQFFFSLHNENLDDLGSAAQSLQEQFAEMSRQRLEVAFSAMASLFRRVPGWLWLKIIKRSSNGYLNSFFFSHTGECLPEAATFCGAPILNAWHIPTVSQPPGTGIFYCQRSGQLTAAISWVDGVLRPGELELLRSQIRDDLLGP